MDVNEKTLKALRELAKTLPTHSSVDLCIRDKRGRGVCHKFRVVDGVMHHGGSHSNEFVLSGKGALR
jgi:hypothetical protein